MLIHFTIHAFTKKKGTISQKISFELCSLVALKNISSQISEMTKESMYFCDLILVSVFMFRMNKWNRFKKIPSWAFHSFKFIACKQSINRKSFKYHQILYYSLDFFAWNSWNINITFKVISCLPFHFIFRLYFLVSFNFAFLILSLFFSLHFF